MMELFLPISLAATAGVLGGVLSQFWNPSNRWRAYLLHFAAGLLTGVIAADLLPNILENGRPHLIIASFVAGAVMVMGLQNFFSHHKKGREGKKKTYGLAVSAGIDTGMDGLIIGAGFSASSELGILLSVVLGLELFVLTLSVGEEFHAQQASRTKAIAVTSTVAGMLTIGVGLGYWLLSSLPDQALVNALAFSTAALLYLAVEELLSKGHEVRQSPFTTASFLFGFLVFMSYSLFKSA